MRRFLWIGVILIGVSLSPRTAAQQTSATDAAIARAGDVYISEEEFLERYELLPGFGRHKKSQQEAAKLELLYSMIAEKLLAQTGEARGLLGDSVVHGAVEQIKKMLGRDELYRAEIVRKVTLSPAEIDAGMNRAQFSVQTRYIYFDKETDARFIRSRLKGISDFERLQIDSSFHAERDTATIVWGDADVSIESAAYALRHGEISKPIHAASGWYLISPISKRRNDFYANTAPDVLRERVTTQLRRRKERARLDDFLADVLRDKTGYGCPEPMRALARAIDEVYHDGSADSTLFLTPMRVDRMKEVCRPILNDTIAVAGLRAFSVDEAIEMLRSDTFGIQRNALRYIPQKLNTEIETMVQRELLGQEALARRLDRVPDVRRRVEMWTQAMLAGTVKDSVRRSVRVSDAEVWAYLKSRDSAIVVPQVQLRELRTSSMEEMQTALRDLDKGDSLATVVRRWSRDAAMRASGGLTPFFPVTSRLPLGELAATMEPGQREGPLHTGDGEVYFEVVAKRSGLDSTDTSMTNRFVRARKDLLAMKVRRATTLLIAAEAKQRGFTIYADRLRLLEVSSTPMMTFRILGFGGRMLPVPFVDPQLDWLEEESPDQTVAP